ncbi:putative phosphatidate phosphatase [Tubulanus polymorphus]|uniref:putative phosphatidate phosphatase n=1 Tax=Tubulanus polymorphus TaxID=672921 RepID=UPI003DA31F4C
MPSPSSLRGKLLYIVTDVVCFVIAALPNILMKEYMPPYHRGFYCDDESLKHPYKGSTVPWTLCICVGVLLPAVVIFIVELFHYLDDRKRNQGSSKYQLGSVPVASFLWNWYKHTGVFGFGLALSQTFNGIGKYSIGRLRPHFLTVCDPDYSQLNCTGLNNMQRYVIDENICRGDAAAIKEARLSFPSGHASFSWYCMLYLAIYLQCRMTWNGSKLAKHLLQGVVILLAYFTALSRISDYKHHPTDVLSGSVLGILFSLLTAFCVSELFDKNDQASRADDTDILVGGMENPLQSDVQIQLSNKE